VALARQKKGRLSLNKHLAIAFKLIMSAQEQWHMLRAPSQMQAFINGLAFKDGIKQSQIATFPA
jgi:hypothetical protein